MQKFKDNNSNDPELMELSPELNEDIQNNEINKRNNHIEQDDVVMDIELENPPNNGPDSGHEEDSAVNQEAINEEWQLIKERNIDMLCAIYLNIKNLLRPLKPKRNTHRTCFEYKMVSSYVRTLERCWNFLKQITGQNNEPSNLPLEKLMDLTPRNWINKVNRFMMIFMQYPIAYALLEVLVVKEPMFLRIFQKVRKSYHAM
ncbi:unnamed protein product [Caenorhabditis angaria]|uniref:Uncharacterized protein n=1 Tax=Caenorhabditis angaria TaxID=860376 RepID=A0A9P1IU79_9PELO|nr:unnamed protein product [Caenorhabditis angaria]